MNIAVFERENVIAPARYPNTPCGSRNSSMIALPVILGTVNELEKWPVSLVGKR